MNRRGFAGATLAGLGGLFFSQKVNAHALSASLKFGDAVRVKSTGAPLWSEMVGEGDERRLSHSQTVCCYIVYISKESVHMNCKGYPISFTWNESDRTWRYFETTIVQIEVIDPKEV